MMSLFRYSVFCFTVCLSATAWASKPLLNIAHWQTDNGVRVYFVATKQLPMLNIRMAFDAGAARDGNKPGLAAMTNNLMGQATDHQNTEAIANTFDRIGAIFSTDVNRDEAILSLDTLTDSAQLPTALHTFHMVLTQATFPASNIERVKKQTLLALQAQKQNADQIARNLFYASTYQQTPYAHNPTGDRHTINMLTAQDIQSFYQQYYVASNAVMVLVGDVTEKQARKMANELTQGLPRGKPAIALPLIKAKRQAIKKTVPFPSTQTTLMLGQVGINRHDPDYFSLSVGNYILGGGAFSSRLFKTVRVKEGLTYSISSGFLPLQAGGPFVIHLKSRNTVADRALQLTWQVLTRFLEQGPSQAELTDAKKNITGRFASQLSSNAAIAANVLSIAFYHLPLDYLDTYSDKINRVTVTDIHRAFVHLIDPNAMTLILVGDSHDKTT